VLVTLQALHRRRASVRPHGSLGRLTPSEFAINGQKADPEAQKLWLSALRKPGQRHSDLNVRQDEYMTNTHNRIGLLLVLAIAFASGCASTHSPQRSQVQLLRELGECVRTTKSHTDDYQSLCISRGFAFDGLIGEPRSDVVKYLGSEEPQDADMYVYPLSSFADVPNRLGGPILVRIHFDARGRVASVDLMVVQ
jgi:hypothetical protein